MDSAGEVAFELVLTLLPVLILGVATAVVVALTGLVISVAGGGDWGAAFRLPLI
jgi:hypothetical protein